MSYAYALRLVRLYFIKQRRKREIDRLMRLRSAAQYWS